MQKSEACHKSMKFMYTAKIQTRDIPVKKYEFKLGKKRK